MIGERRQRPEVTDHVTHGFEPALQAVTIAD